MKNKKHDWKARRKTSKSNWKKIGKKCFTHRPKINCFFVFKRFSEWRSYIWTEQKCKNEKQTNRDNLIYKTGNKKKNKSYDFQKCKTIRSFGRKIYKNNLSLDDAIELQVRLKDDTDIFK